MRASEAQVDEDVGAESSPLIQPKQAARFLLPAAVQALMEDIDRLA